MCKSLFFNVFDFFLKLWVIDYINYHNSHTRTDKNSKPHIFSFYLFDGAKVRKKVESTKYFIRKIWDLTLFTKTTMGLPHGKPIIQLKT
jgi:hypothetical protein